MGPLEICLILIGVICIVVSFIFVSKDEGNVGMSSGELTKGQLESIREQVDSLIDEQISSLEEHTEITMEKISNRKIMELSEYSETVLQQINRNHEETMFLYDMLNEKSKEVKKIVSDFSKESKNIAKQVAQNESLQSENSQSKSASNEVTKVEEKKPARARRTKAKSDEDVALAEVAATVEQEQPKPKRKRTTKASGSSNNNEKILKLHKEGKSVVEIARLLNLGIGEVKLVIDLFRGEL